MGDLKTAFDKFAKTKVQSGLTSKEATDWFKAANLLAKPGKGKFTSNDLDIQYSSAKGKDLGLTFAKLDVLLDKVKVSYAKDVKKGEDEAKQMMKDALGKAEPTKTGTGTSKTGGVDRMTDASKYTGAHKQRFDADGKGKGIAGREERAENTGYVGAYKGKDTYDKKH